MVDHNQHGSVALPPPPKQEIKSFTYTPLNHLKASLRLVRVLEAESPEGYMQCEIRHATIEDSYICLSYVWGEEVPGHTIVLDKQHYRIRGNLYSFLVKTRRKRRLLENWLWIDALSINQNDIEERNHQVQQMGLIFSRAKEVLSWLGDSHGIAAYLDRTEQRYIQGRGYQLERLCQGTTEYYQQLEFYQSEYWKRAWITQEVALARQVTLCAGLAEMTFELFPSTYFDGMPPTPNMESGRRTGFKGRSLIYLINWFKAKESHERRDCIYSLLALCGDGSDLQVDYNSSEIELAKVILSCCKQSFCLCSIETIAYTLSIKEYDFWNFSGHTSNVASEPFAYMILPVIRGAHRLWKDGSKVDEPIDSQFEQHNQQAGVSCIELSRNEEMAVVIDSKGDTWVIIFPQQICPTSCAALFQMKIKAGTSHTTIFACDVYGRKAKRTLEYGVSTSFALKPSDETCKVFFSFELLLTFVDGLHFERPCDRVNFQGTRDKTRISKPLLQLCS
jgi:hypothetical protein